jgi:hypothetical protein
MTYSDNYYLNEKSGLEENYMSRFYRMSRLSFRMQPEQRDLIKYLRFKWLILFDIHHELLFIFGEEMYTIVSVKHWIHELKTGEQSSQTKIKQEDFRLIVLTC